MGVHSGGVLVFGVVAQESRDIAIVRRREGGT